MPEIIDIHGREILDSRGNPTVEVDVYISGETYGRAKVPSGASTGAHEALELRDKDKNRYGGKGVLQAVENVNTVIAPELKGLDVCEQTEIDRVLLALDGTKGKTNLGANAILGVSLACAKAAAEYCQLPLYRYIGGVSANMMPIPMMNIINGGEHADNKLDIQEFMILPIGAKTFREALRMGTEIYHVLKKLLQAKNLATAVGDEGGFAPNFQSNDQAIEAIIEACEKAHYAPGKDIVIGLDVAASELYDKKRGLYVFASENKEFNSNDFAGYFTNLAEKYPIVSIEDGMDEDDWEGWQLMNQSIGSKVQLVGDDLYVTNPERIAQGMANNASNAVLVKVNQIGSLTETMNAINMTHNAGWRTIISHRSGETEDTFISDLAVAVCSGQIKTGAPCRAERVAKYNQLLRIEEELGGSATYPTGFYGRFA